MGESVPWVPHPAENFFGGANHEDMFGRLIPAEHEVAAGEAGGDVRLGVIRKHARHARGGGGSPAGEGFAAPPLPGAHGDLRGRIHLNKGDIHALGEDGLGFQKGAESGEGHGVYMIAVDDEVRVPQ